MLKFSCSPDPAFKEIVTGSLELAYDMLRDELAVDDESPYPALEKIFTRAELVAEIEKLLTAQKSETLYMPTEYHWLILYRALEDGIAIHNDFFREDGSQQFAAVRLGEIDFDAVVDIYFWDTDFLFDPQACDTFTEKQKGELIRAGTWGVVNGPKPRPEDLVMDVYSGGDWDKAEEDMYKPGENYPSYSGE